MILWIIVDNNSMSFMQFKMWNHEKDSDINDSQLAKMEKSIPDMSLP